MSASSSATGHAAHDPRLHLDPVSGRTVFVAPMRAARPHDADRPADADTTTAPRGWCPFCIGSEHRTPPAWLRAPADAALPWRARIVPNLYPFAVESPHAVEATGGHGLPLPRAAHGVHDVVIEAATHERTVAAVAADDWRNVWELCRQRLEMLAGRSDLAWATVFKNSGPQAGASLEHLHSQLVALDFVPGVLHAEMAAVARAPGLFADVIASADRAGRVVAERADLVLLVPEAPRQPFETWILPRSPEPFFHATTPARVAAVGDLTQLYVSRLERLVPGSHFNWWLHQLPFGGRAPAAARATWHWHLEILPRLSAFAGFELATGCHITPLSPDESAARLRGPVTP
jgi:UDPglucose--hexose-1-phosphate uridylyltransferase